MWIVELALRRMYTFVVAAVLIAVLGAVSIYRMSTDIFPEIDIPVVSVVWQYFGMPLRENKAACALSWFRAKAGGGEDWGVGETLGQGAGQTGQECDNLQHLFVRELLIQLDPGHDPH